MRLSRALFSLGVLACVAFSGAVFAMAQTAGNDARNLAGVWSVQEGPRIPGSRQELQGGSTVFSLVETTLPLQPWALEHCNQIGCGKDVNAFGWPTGEAADQTKDPYIMKCAPLGFPRVMLGTFEVFHVPGRILMRFPDNSMRDIWVDGRGHPEDPYGLWMGHSIGRWEGDTLVVDSVGMIDATWLNSFGTPHSDELHVVERFRRTSPTTMELDILLEDPKTFTQPISGKLVYGIRERELEPIVTCEDKILADNPEDAWPFFVGEYPEIPILDTVPRIKAPR